MNSTISSLPAATSIDPVNDYLPIDTASPNATNKINRNVFLGLSSQPLGVTDNQSPTNKTFNNTNIFTIKDSNLTLQNSSSITKQAQFSLSSITVGQTRTINIPDASGTLALLGSTQTFTGANSFNGSSWTGGTIDNANITVDSVSGHTTPNSGTIYGLAITNSQISAANSILPAALVTGITSDKLSNPYKFSVYRNAALSIANNAVVVFDTKEFDSGSNYSTSTGNFTAPVAGFYFFSGNLSVLPDSSSHFYATAIYKNGVSLKRGVQLSGTTNALGPSINSIIQCAAGDNITINLEANSGASNPLNTGGPNPQLVWFSGFLVSTT